jgi:hypothetical protein
MVLHPRFIIHKEHEGPKENSKIQYQFPPKYFSKMRTPLLGITIRALGALRGFMKKSASGALPAGQIVWIAHEIHTGIGFARIQIIHGVLKRFGDRIQLGKSQPNRP